MEAALRASRVVGRYEDGLTSALATDIGLSVSQVENLADAGTAYRYIRPHCNRFGLNSELRKRLTPSHWAAAGRLQAQYNIMPPELVSDLIEAARDGVSVATMARNISGQYGNETEDDDLADVLRGEYERLQKVMARDDIEPVKPNVSRAMKELDAAAVKAEKVK
jgi:hypothetical protein